ncbi:Hypothetical protein A7982_07855 [Minicystis rosea]|nr:Hypothetical protein A7982_07855 [Minicystis rosea]
MRGRQDLEAVVLAALAHRVARLTIIVGGRVEQVIEDLRGPHAGMSNKATASATANSGGLVDLPIRDWR